MAFIVMTGSRRIQVFNLSTGLAILDKEVEPFLREVYISSWIGRYPLMT